MLSKCRENILEEKEILNQKVYVVKQVDYVVLPQYFKYKYEIQSKEDDPFYIFNIGDVYRKILLWKEKFPKVTPFYAIKSNPHPIIIGLMSYFDMSFDCASLEEIKLVMSYGVSPDRIVFANPCKFPSHLTYAREVGVDKMTFDSEEELYKIKSYYPEAKLLLRIFVETSTARCPLGLKFGAPFDTVETLVQISLKLNLDLIGVSFHVGSGCTDANVYAKAIEDSCKVFQIAKKFGFDMKYVDIGGGFPGDMEYQNSRDLLDACSAIVNSSVDKYFYGENYTVISEPGRFFCASAMRLVTTVVSEANSHRKNETTHQTYFLNDGVHGSFNCTVFDHFMGESYIIPKSDTPILSENYVINTYIGTNVSDRSSSDLKENQKYITSFVGPSGIQSDVLIKDQLFPKVSIDDIVVFKNMGAYTRCAASNFSGLVIPDTFNIISVEDYDALKQHIPFI